MLVERGPFLEQLLEAAPSGATASGCWLFLGGEAGVGKTSLVRLLTQRLAELPEPPVVRRGSCDGLATPAPLGPAMEALPELESAMDETTPATRPRLFRQVRARLAERPTVLVLEDLHWADEATLELVRFLAARLDGLPLLAIATFRADEVGPGDPLTAVLGDLATTRGVVRMHLPALSTAAVSRLVESSGSTLDAEALHGRTGGNPFYVTEVLAAESEDLPATVRDAVRARMTRISPAARRVLDAAAVLGPGTGLPLLAEVAGEWPEAVDECVHHGLLVPEPTGAGLAFRHEIARETVDAGLSPAERTRLHGRALATLTAHGSTDDHRLAHHAAQSAQGHLAVAHAREAALRSARLGAHREAAREYRLALRFTDVLSAPDTAELHERLSYECYLTDELDAAIEERGRALALHQLLGDLEGVGRSQRWLSRLSWFLGRGEDAARYADLALESTRSLEPGHERAMALSNKAQLAMLAGEESEAVRYGGQAIEMAHAMGDTEVEAHALNNVGTAQSLGSHRLEGLARIRQSLDLALTADLHEHVARAYTNLGASQVLHRTFATADAELRAGISYCADRDLEAWRWYMTAWLAKSALEQGRYDDAARLAQDVLRQPGIPPVSTLPGLIVAGTVALRRGEPRADDLLDAAHELAAPTMEAQRIVPVAVARAEAAWVRDDLEAAATELRRARAAEGQHGEINDYERGELAWWLRLVGDQETHPGVLAPPFDLMVRGEWARAARAWEGYGCPWWQAVCLAQTASVDDARAAVELLSAVGAPATVGALLRDRHRAGLPVPRSPRASTRRNAGGLTSRELEVLELLADGLSNTQIGERLFLSPKTVGHHVSAVLRKMDEPSRSAAAATARRRGLLANLGTSPDVPSRAQELSGGGPKDGPHE